MTDQVTQSEEENLKALESRFMAALEMREQGRVDESFDELQAIISIEPRLPEPRMELSRILLDTDRVESAVEHARLALEHLEASGPWINNFPANTILALAHAILAEGLRRRADEDDIIFGDPEQFKGIITESRAHFQRASELDDADAYSSYYAFFMGAKSSGPT